LLTFGDADDREAPTSGGPRDFKKAAGAAHKKQEEAMRVLSRHRAYGS
jgi:hypothetical protein